MSEKYNIVFVFTACKRTGPTQQMLNIAKNLDKDSFNLYLITLYDEENNNSRLDKYMEVGFTHYRVPLTQIDLLIGKTRALKKKLMELHPSIIHSLGVLPDYAISKMGFNCHVITLRNYVYDDLIAWYGKYKGLMLVKLHLFAMQHTTKTFTCSQSLSVKYKENLGMEFDYIRNGVDVTRFKTVTIERKQELRRELGLPLNSIIFIYTGRLSSRKDQEFLLKLFSNNNELKDYVFLLMTEGAEYERLLNTYANDHILMPGFKPNIDEYLQASDFYISCSKSEGLPNGVLEAMAVGLPVILSDIPQHLEVYDADPRMGSTFRLGDEKDCITKIIETIHKDYNVMSNAAYKSAHEKFSDYRMSQSYQEAYRRIIDCNQNA